MKKLTKKKQKQSNPSPTTPASEERIVSPEEAQIILLQQLVNQVELVKYNLYMCARATIFSALITTEFSYQEALDQTEETLSQLDTYKKSLSQKQG